MFAASATLEKGAEKVLRLVDNMESSKVSVAIVDPGCSELSLRRETVKEDLMRQALKENWPPDVFVDEAEAQSERKLS